MGRGRLRLIVGLALFALLLPGRPKAASSRLVGPFSKDEYPQAVIDRPLTLPAGMVEAEIGGQFISQRFDERILGVGGTDDWIADVAVRVGVTDRFQIEAGTAFSLAHELRDTDTFFGFDPVDSRPSLTSWQRVVPLRLSLLALDTEVLDTAVTLTLPFVAYAERRFVFNDRRNINESFISRNSNGRLIPEVQIAAPTRWRLSDWLWLRAGENLFSVTTGDGVGQFAFDFGVGVQPHRVFALTIDSRIARVTFDGSGNDSSETVADVGTLDLEGVLAPLPWFDVIGGLVIPDLGRDFKDYLTRVAVRVRF